MLFFVFMFMFCFFFNHSISSLTIKKTFFMCVFPGLSMLIHSVQKNISMIDYKSTSRSTFQETLLSIKVECFHKTENYFNSKIVKGLKQSPLTIRIEIKQKLYKDNIMHSLIIFHCIAIPGFVWLISKTMYLYQCSCPVSLV